MRRAACGLALALGVAALAGAARAAAPAGDEGAAEPTAADAAAPAGGLDLDTLVVPKPVAPVQRKPEEDIRRVLRPENSLLQTRENLDKSIRERESRLAQLEAQEDLLRRDLERATAEFEALTAARDAERAVVRRRLRTMMRVKERPPIEVLLGSTSFKAYSGELEALERLYEADRRRVVAYREQLAVWNRQREDLARRRTNLANTIETIAYIRQDLAWDQEEKTALLEAVRTQAEFYAVWAREMEALDEVVAKKVEEVLDPGRARLYFAETMGALASPIRNPDIVGRFGIRKHPKFGTQTTSRGVELVPFRPGNPTEVRAVYWGYVAYIGWIRGLGRVVILDHTLGYASVYAHLDQATVEIGEKVKTGEPIGTMGDTGSFWGARLYLEMRKDGRALDPLRYMK
ncbi:MAG: peptidoglycan DD-metalloendopeptidase family protein [Deltaproteobacteria bacterium]|nr:peptidoglycan DD-metalloendopeptidase family protein [Deltaproteobacteria bacterium]